MPVRQYQLGDRVRRIRRTATGQPTEPYGEVMTVIGSESYTSNGREWPVYLLRGELGVISRSDHLLAPAYSPDLSWRLQAAIATRLTDQPLPIATGETLTPLQARRDTERQAR